jgi:hypothetical protein
MGPSGQVTLVPGRKTRPRDDEADVPQRGGHHQPRPHSSICQDPGGSRGRLTGYLQRHVHPFSSSFRL